MMEFVVGQKVQVTLWRKREILDATVLRKIDSVSIGQDYMENVYNLDCIFNPLDANLIPWLVLEGTKIGATTKWWTDLEGEEGNIAKLTVITVTSA